MSVKKFTIVFWLSLCAFLIWLSFRLVSMRNELQAAYSAHAETLECIIAAQIALEDGRDEALSLVSDSLDEARVISALYFSENEIFHKDVMFIMEYDDEKLLKSHFIDEKQKQIISEYLEESRVMDP